MKSLLYLLTGLILLSGCAVTGDTMTARQEQKQARKAAEIAAVKKAVESRQYIIRINKIYMIGGSWADLVPRSNFLIIDGEKATVSLGYIGRSFGSRPISGINFRGSTVNYILDSDQTKGIYKVEAKVAKGNDTFDFFITIGSEGYCSLTVNNAFIQSVSYKGSLVPITTLPELQKKKQIIL